MVVEGTKTSTCEGEEGEDFVAMWRDRHQARTMYYGCKRQAGRQLEEGGGGSFKRKQKKGIIREKR